MVPQPGAIPVENTSFTYDANGNMTAGGGRTVTWTSFDMVRTITAGALSTSFDYDGEHNRIRQVTATETTHYFWAGALGVPAEKAVAFGGQTAWKEYVLAGGQTVAQQVTFLDPQGAVTSTHRRYFVSDHLGSIAVVLDEAGAVLERLSYDAWGKRRNADGSDDPAGVLTSEVSRGYTGHEMLDGFGLVHMNGRIYDPLIGRFLSPDPNIQERFNSQNLNRYAYVLNNPLSMTDPSGYFFSKIVKGIGKAIRAIIKFVGRRQFLAVAAYVALMVALPNIMPSIVAAGIAGGTAGAIATGTVDGAVTGATVAMITHGTLAVIGEANLGVYAEVESTRVFLATMGHVTGGGFRATYIAATVAGMGEAIGGTLGIESFEANLVVQAVLGGVGAELGGGKFADGFATAAFQYASGVTAQRFMERFEQGRVPPGEQYARVSSRNPCQLASVAPNEPCGLGGGPLRGIGGAGGGGGGGGGGRGPSAIQRAYDSVVRWLTGDRGSVQAIDLLP